MEKIWYRQPGESEIAFRAFSTYLNQPLPRTMNYMSKATTHSQTSLQKWSKKFKWADRALAYDNTRADMIMAQDVNIMNKYQQTITEGGLADMQLLRAAWQQLFEKVMTGDHPLGGQIEALQKLTNARMNIEKLARTSARMPDRYKSQTVDDSDAAIPTDFIQLTLPGAKQENVEHGQPESPEATEQLGGEIISLTSEATSGEELTSEI